MYKYLFLCAALLALLTSASCAAGGGVGETAGLTQASVSPIISQAAEADCGGDDEPRDIGYTSPMSRLKCLFFDEKCFEIYDGCAADYPVSGPVLCGTAPHHLTAGQLISGFFKAAAKSREAENAVPVETVVIVATSHYEGGSAFYTTLSDWESPFGVVGTNGEICEYFRTELGAETDDERLMNDHSAAAHIPFAKYYFPNASTACLLVAPSRDGETPRRLAEALYDLPDRDKCLFLFSIDFSHYLPSYETETQDEITRRAVNERNFAAIECFDNNNVDSPVCLSAYVRLSDMLGGEIYEADNSNTLKVSLVPYSEEMYDEGVTSYFVFLTS